MTDSENNESEPLLEEAQNTVVLSLTPGVQGIIAVAATTGDIMSAFKKDEKMTFAKVPQDHR